MMKIWLILSILTIGSSPLYSQVLRGVVKDSTSGKSLPFANVVMLGSFNGMCTNENGTFEITPNKTNSDTLKVSAIGYAPKYIPVNTNTSDTLLFNVELNKITYTLGEIVVAPKSKQKRKSIKLGYDRANSKNGLRSCIAGSLLAVYIPNALANVGIINQATIVFSKNKHSKMSEPIDIRLRIFSLDSNGQSPGADLLAENVLINPPPKGKLTMDISRYNIVFPAEGVFIGVEWVDSKNITKGKRGATEPSIRCTFQYEKSVTWTNFRDRKWVHDSKFANPEGNIGNPMIGIEVLTFSD